MFDRGSFLGRFVSVLMIRWEALRWARAETTCWELKPGFNGTYVGENLDVCFPTEIDGNIPQVSLKLNTYNWRIDFKRHEKKHSNGVTEYARGQPHVTIIGF